MVVVIVVLVVVKVSVGVTLAVVVGMLYVYHLQVSGVRSYGCGGGYNDGSGVAVCCSGIFFFLIFFLEIKDILEVMIHAAT